VSVICSLRFVSEPLIARLDPRCCGEINWTMVSAIPLYWAPLERSAPESVSMEKPNRFWEVRFLESEASWTSCMRRRRTRFIQCAVHISADGLGISAGHPRQTGAVYVEAKNKATPKIQIEPIPTYRQYHRPIASFQRLCFYASSTYESIPYAQNENFSGAHYGSSYCHRNARPSRSDTS
jgi:hypothetical protein